MRKKYLAVVVISAISSWLCASSWAADVQGSPTGLVDPLRKTWEDVKRIESQRETQKKNYEAELNAMSEKIRAAQAKTQAIAMKDEEIRKLQTKAQEIDVRIQTAEGHLRTAAGELKMYRMNRSFGDAVSDNLQFWSTPEAEKKLNRAEEAYRSIQNEREPIGKQLTALTEEARQLKANADADLRAAAELQPKIEETNRRLAGWESETSREIQAKMSSFAQDVYSQAKSEVADTRFLLMDLKVLQAQYNMQDAQMDAMKANIDSWLNDTLLGHYVNGQLKKAMDSICDRQAQCAARSSQTIQPAIERGTAARPPVDSRQVGQAGDKPAGGQVPASANPPGGRMVPRAETAQ